MDWVDQNSLSASQRLGLMGTLADTEPKPQDIFVFGSNLRGIHKKGAALEAVQSWGAINGQSEGLQGNAYAIPTKSSPYQELFLTEIGKYVETFKEFARTEGMRRNMVFKLTAIGTGYGGHAVSHIAPMFADAPFNVHLPFQFLIALGRRAEAQTAWDLEWRKTRR